MTKQMELRIGDTVQVTPTNPLAKGRGVGVVTRVGQTLVRVRFNGAETKADRDGLACLLRDCQPIRTSAVSA